VDDRVVVVVVVPPPSPAACCPSPVSRSAKYQTAASTSTAASAAPSQIAAWLRLGGAVGCWNGGCPDCAGTPGGGVDGGLGGGVDGRATGTVTTGEVSTCLGPPRPPTVSCDRSARSAAASG
jgi:hypothetical protein